MKILIIGCGSIGRRHASTAAKFVEVAVIDKDVGLAANTAQEVGALQFPSIQEALAWNPDGVVIATPHDSHLALANLAIEAGADVLIEKPISCNEEGLFEFLGHVQKMKRRAYVVCNMRFHPGPAMLKQSLPKIGEPLFARASVGNYLPSMRPNADYRKLYAANRSRGGGVILDAIHEIDYLYWLFGDVAMVGCHAAKLSDLDIDVEDFAEINLRHLSGAYSSVHMDYLQRFKRRGCEIVGTMGTLIWQSDGKQPEQCKVSLFTIATGMWETIYSNEQIEVSDPYSRLMQEFIKAISNKTSETLLSAEIAARELHIAMAAKQSAQQLRSITL
jgi:predicted dehydrogenase